MKGYGKYKKVKINGKCYQEHNLIWEEAYGPIPEGSEVHHKDGDKANNALENLELRDRTSHRREHSENYFEQPDGTWLKRCTDCGEVKELSAFHRRRGRAEDSVQNKCKSCANAYARKRYAEREDVRKKKVQMSREYREENPEKARAACRASYRRRQNS